MSTLRLASLASPEVSAGLGIDWSVLGIVLLGVTALMLLIRGVGNWAAKSISDPVAKTKVGTPRAGRSSATQEEPEVGPELIAVLTAAATAALGSPVRLTSISVGKMAAQRSWSVEGRREIYMSHRIR